MILGVFMCYWWWWILFQVVFSSLFFFFFFFFFSFFLFLLLLPFVVMGCFGVLSGGVMRGLWFLFVVVVVSFLVAVSLLL